MTNGNVYFNGDKSKTELKVSDLYGRGYYLTANETAYLAHILE